jgi:hypothetical protein
MKKSAPTRSALSHIQSYWNGNAAGNVGAFGFAMFSGSNTGALGAFGAAIAGMFITGGLGALIVKPNATDGTTNPINTTTAIPFFIGQYAYAFNTSTLT